VASTNGFILGLIGGLLDFASASLLLVGQSGSSMMNPVSVYEWAALLVLLGVAVIVTSILSVVTLGLRFVKVFSLLMIVYGILMMFIGGAMTAGFIMASDVSSIYSYGMVIVGAAMAVNGILMSRNPMPI
jgi:hypothetical protein